MKTGKNFYVKKYKLMMYGDKSMKEKGSNFGTANFVWKWFIFILDSQRLCFGSQRWFNIFSFKSFCKRDRDLFKNNFVCFRWKGIYSCVFNSHLT